MRLNRYTVKPVLSIILCLTLFQSYGQLGISFNLKKPKEYDDRVLRSEKSDEKKFTLPRRFIQNAVTRYNYFFNANNKLNEIIERAKEQHHDDFSKLLSFYNYSLDVTKKDSIQIDSVMYKSESGIALHDLRNDWADNLYLLWGAAYYLRKDFDSAYLMFQFINYAFADKEKDGYYKTIGSSMDGNQAFSISTKEKTSLPKKIFAEPPSRNDAFIWQIRNFLMQDQFAEAASLIATLKDDPLFPKRLDAELNEVQAFWFYKQNMWDSAAEHLVNALDVAANKNEKARWEYLAAQMYELAGKPSEAEKLYSKVISHTTDPVMEVYARLSSIRVNTNGGDNYVDKNIAELLKMAKKDRYDEYRDIIYYMAAQMELDRNNLTAAETLLQKSIKYFSGNIQQRNKAFLQLAEIAYSKKLYHAAFNYYDSLNLNDPSLPDTAAINKRRDMLAKVVINLDIIDRQDSLQKIAGMAEDERKEFVKKLVKDLRKQQGLKEETTYTSTSPFGQQTSQNPFSTTNPKGDWYFYNTDARTKGHSDFIATWGNRANNDNWRRSSVASSSFGTQTAQQTNDKLNSKTGNNTDNGEISFDNLYNKLPLTPEKIKTSDDSISNAMFNLGKLYAQEVEDCAASTETLESLRNRFPAFDKMDEVLFNLYYCYSKNGETAKAEQVKKLMNDKYPKSNFTTIVTTGKDPLSKTDNPEATKEYESIYDLFIEGNFAEAVAKKKVADSIYGKNYWTPQLLYIEAVYYIKQRQDSVAKNVLNSIVTQFPKTKIAEKATTMIDVLSRRAQIEKELENYVIREPKQEEIIKNPVVKDTTSIQPKQIVASRTDTTKNIVAINKPQIDTNALKPKIPPTPPSQFSYTPDAVHYVMIVLTKVDPIFSGEAKNAFFRYNREAYYNKQMTADVDELDAENKLLLIGSFKDADEAIDYIAKAKPLAPTEIIPWLKGGKYIFTIITDKNLEALKANKNLEDYKKFLSEKFPGKF